jgi:hypothetical protein
MKVRPIPTAVLPCRTLCDCENPRVESRRHEGYHRGVRSLVAITLARFTNATHGPNSMAHDVFVSYSQSDKPTADAACAALESAGIRCWIAPRDVPAGMSWPAAIVGAIGQCRVMVLVFSSHAVASEEVQREVVQAFQHRIVVVPLRIEDVRPSGDMAYYMSSTHWLDALTPPLTARLNELCQTVQAILSTPRGKQDMRTSPSASNSATGPPAAASTIRDQYIRTDSIDAESVRVDPGIAARRHGAFMSSRFAKIISVTTLIVTMLATVAAFGVAAISREHDLPVVYAAFLSLAIFPMLAITASRRWVVSSRILAFLVGWFLTVCSAGLAFIAAVFIWKVAAINLYPDAILDLLVLLLFLGATVGVVVGLIRAFPMMPKPRAND